GVVDAAPGGRVEAGIEATDRGVLRPCRGLRELLDLFGLIAGEQEEVAEALGKVDLDDVPEDRPAADFDERLGNRLRVLLQPRAAAATQDRDRGQHGGETSGCRGDQPSAS